MKLKYLLFFILLIISYFGNAQTNQWAWVGGDSTYNNKGNYGVKGVGSSVNKPRIKQDGVYWKDKSNNIWMFGGSLSNSNGYDTLYNDLWKFDILTKQWTWISGDSTMNNFGVYGKKGVKASKNKPGARKGSLSWVDTTGNLWLFGGQGFAYSNIGTDGLNDLWKYDISSNQWTYVSGDSNLTGISNRINIKGVYNNINTPTARMYSCGWVDNLNDLWFYGGFGVGYNYSQQGQMNDLWKYNISSNQWMWVNGDSVSFKSSVYGNLGVPDTLNQPGARCWMNTWVDQSGNLWLYGGTTYDKQFNLNVYNDLWKFIPNTNKWVWIGGDSNFNKKPIYGIRNVSNVTSEIGARANSTLWKDNQGNIWFYGGYNMLTNIAYSYYNDLWKYNMNSNLWTWESGDSSFDILGKYGIKNQYSNSNNPSAKVGAFGISDTSGSLMLIGGMKIQNSNYYINNDIWIFKPGKDSIANSTFNMSGNILTPKYNSVKNIDLKIKGINGVINNLDSLGAYNLNLVTGNYTLTPSKNNDINKTNGVTTLDLALVQSHVLGKNKLNSPYKIIAADVNGDGKITTLDLVYMKRLILGIDTTFTNSTTKENRLWAFVDSSYQFPDTTNPFPFKDSISYIGLSANKTNQTFIGVKLGDVNWDWNPALARIPSKVFVRPKKIIINQ